MTCNLQVLTCNLQVLTCTLQVLICDLQVLTCNLQVLTCDLQVLTWQDLSPTTWQTILREVPVEPTWLDLLAKKRTNHFLQIK